MSEIRHLERATAVEARHAPAPRIADTHAPRTSRLRIALVAEAAVIGVPDARTGERLVACLVPHPELTTAAPPADEHLAEFCRERLSHYKVPAEFRWLDALPRNHLGKVVKKRLVNPSSSSPPPDHQAKL